MNMKKLTRVIPFIIVTAMALTGCQGNSSTSSTTASQGNKGNQLVVSWWGNQTRNERTQKILELYTSKNPDITFDGQFAEWSDYWNKLATSSAGHTLPDIVQMDYKYLSQYVSNGLLADLSPYVASGQLDLSHVDEGIVNSGKSGEGVYAVCNGVNAPALFYNKTLLDQNGITVKDNMSISDFIELSKKVYEKTGYKTNIAYGAGDNFIEYKMRDEGHILYEQDKLGVSSASDFESFFKLYEDGIKEGWHIAPDVFAEITVGSVEQDPLVYGSNPSNMSWCFFAYSNQMTAIQAAAPEGTEIGITTWPADNPEKANYLKPSQFFAVTVDSKNPEEAAKVLDFITNDIECNNILLGERGVPASSEVAEAISGNMDEISQKVITYINDVVTPVSSEVSPAAPEGSSEVLALINQLVEQVCYGEKTAQEASVELYEKGNEILASK